MNDPRREPTGPSGSVKPFLKMIKSFKDMELSSSSEEMKILAQQFVKFDRQLRKGSADRDLRKLIGYGNNAVSILLSNQNFNIPCFGEHVDNGNPNRSLGSSLLRASFLNMMGIACSKLESYDQSLVCLKRAEEILPDLESYDDSLGCVDCCLVIWHVNQFQLYKVKRKLHKLNPASKLIEECPDHMKKILKIKKKIILDENHLELGDANRDVSFAYLLSSNFTEAVPYLVKALEIYGDGGHFHPRSDEILQFRRYISVMYCNAKDYVKALEQNSLYQTVLEDMGSSLELLYAKVERGSFLIDAERYDEAIHVIEYVVNHAVADKILLARAFQFLALAYFRIGEFDGAINHLESSSKTLDKLVIDPDDQLQQQLFQELYDRLFKYIGQICEGKQAIKISLLEDVLGKLKMKFGQNSLEVACCSYDLGAAYFESKNFNRAAQNFTCAKGVWDVHLGPSHENTLQAQYGLAQSHAKMRRFDRAIELQENLIKHLAEFGPIQQSILDEMDEMKRGRSRQGCFMGWLLSFSGFFGFTSCFQAE